MTTAPFGDIRFRAPFLAYEKCPWGDRGAYGSDQADALKNLLEHITAVHAPRGNAPAAGRPQIGDLVHYVSYGTPGGEYACECRAAIITAVRCPGGDRAERADLAVLNPSGLFFPADLTEADPRKAGKLTGGTWHRPQADEQ